jgi:hypothetical protein
MVPCVKNYILASNDIVALDAAAAKMMGFDSLSIKLIRLAHERGLGCGDMREIEVVGEDNSAVNFHFHVNDTLGSCGQKMIYCGPLKPLEHLPLRTMLAPWAYIASILYHDVRLENASHRRGRSIRKHRVKQEAFSMSRLQCGPRTDCTQPRVVRTRPVSRPPTANETVGNRRLGVLARIQKSDAILTRMPNPGQNLAICFLAGFHANRITLLPQIIGSHFDMADR